MKKKKIKNENKFYSEVGALFHTKKLFDASFFHEWETKLRPFRQLGFRFVSIASKILTSVHASTQKRKRKKEGKNLKFYKRKAFSGQFTRFNNLCNQQKKFQGGEKKRFIWSRGEEKKGQMKTPYVCLCSNLQAACDDDGCKRIMNSNFFAWPWTWTSTPHASKNRHKRLSKFYLPKKEFQATEKKIKINKPKSKDMLLLPKQKRSLL